MLEAALAVMGTGLFGVVAWVINLGNRVSILEADKVSLKELLDLRLVDITRRLDRIEVKLDAHDEQER